VNCTGNQRLGDTPELSISQWEDLDELCRAPERATFQKTKMRHKAKFQQLVSNYDSSTPTLDKAKVVINLSK